MCQLETTFTDKNTFAELPEALEKLKEMQEDGLVELADDFVKSPRKR